MFAGKAGAYSSGTPFKDPTIRGIILLDLPTNIRLGWKSVPGTDTLAYYEDSKITAVKSFITLTPVL
jgi:hypothetical protein